MLCVLDEVEVSATSQRSPNECGVSECDRGTSAMRKPWPIRGCRAMKKKIAYDHCVFW